MVDGQGRRSGGGKRGADPRLLSGRGCAGAALLDIPQRALRRRSGTSRLVHPWPVRMKRHGKGPDPSRPKSIDRRELNALEKARRKPRGEPRSEEHTSELQSLMHISYAVFCLKKKTNVTIKQKIQQQNTPNIHNITTHQTTS